MRLINADELPVTCTLKAINGKIAVTGWIEAERINEAPTVEAIPVEWLKKKAQEFAERYWSKKDDHKKLILPMADCPIVIEQMIKEWRVENDTENN